MDESEWIKVFETTNYGSFGNVFDGHSEGRATVNAGKGLPAGTYFYVLEYEHTKEGEKSRMVKKTGYLYIKNVE